jgi:glucose/arabinose dehydrogenase
MSPIRNAGKHRGDFQAASIRLRQSAGAEARLRRPDPCAQPVAGRGLHRRDGSERTGPPRGLAFLPDRTKLVTERAGRLSLLGADGQMSTPVAGLPTVDAHGQGGLLDVAAYLLTDAEDGQLLRVVPKP